MSDFKNRATDRTDVDWISIIRLVGGTEIPCAIKDVSASGMKVALSAEVDLPETFNIKVVGRDLVFNVRQAWRRGHFIGLTIQKIGKIPPPKKTSTLEAKSSTPAADYNRIGARRNFRDRD